MSPENVRTIVGYPWLLAPSAPEGNSAGGGPFDPEPPGSVLSLHPITSEEPGLMNHPGAARFLAITNGPSPPPIVDGWEALPAELDEDFATPDGAVALKRVLGLVGVVAVDSPLHKTKIQNCEFEIAEP